MRRKLNFCVVSILIIVLSVGTCFAAADTVHQDLPNEALESLSKEYNLKQIDVIPEGITPLYFDTIEEAQVFLEDKQNKKVIDFSELKVYDESAGGIVPISNYPISEPIESYDENTIEILTTKTGDVTCLSWLPSPAGNINLKVWYTWSSKVGQHHFKSVTNASSYFTGVPAIIDYEEIYSYAELTSNTELYAHCEGILIYFIIIQGTSFEQRDWCERGFEIIRPEDPWYSRVL